ncbi:MAG: hypothetical protein HOG49_20815 [Candidatus Scalindua sp.]|jgi:hypothetical protein|nr:hypothetical protein [Candidatus Scalindua sp.]
MSEQVLEKEFPGLTSSNYRITSDLTGEYNCIAWAANETDVWWEPDPYDLYFWPPGIQRTYTLDAYINAYGTLGYTTCEDTEYEEDYEKIAIYLDSDETPTHAARQLDSGNWTSKLGSLEDIEHNSLDDIICYEYGSSVVVMKRPK